MSHIYTYGEQLEIIAGLGSRAAIVDGLKAIDNPDIRTIFHLMYNDEYVFDIIPQIMVYKPAPIMYNGIEFVLGKNIPNLGTYMTINKNLTPKRKTELFVQLLENMHPKDAELMVDVLNKRHHRKEITRREVKRAYPEIFSNDTDKDDEI